MRQTEIIRSAATLVDLLQQRASETPCHKAYTFLVDGEDLERCITYQELDYQAQAIAAKLVAAGLQPEDRAVLVYPPGLDFITAFLGCLYAKVIAVPAYPPTDRTHTARIPAIVADCQASAVLTLAALAGAAESLLTDGVATVIATDNAQPQRFVTGRIEPSTVAFLQYTSGSTSDPKGVMVTHANILANERMIQEAFEHDESSTFVGWLPLYHDMGLIGNVLQPLYIGARAVLMSPVSFLERPVRWPRAISKYQARTSGGPNFGYELCCRKITPEQCEGLDLSSWTLAFNGAEPVRAETLDKFSEKFAPYGFCKEAFYPCYGLAEATLFVAGGHKGNVPRAMCVDHEALQRNIVQSAEDSSRQLLVSCGHGWGDEQIRIVDPDTGENLTEDKVGEVWLTGSNVTRGYWNRPEAAEESFPRSRFNNVAATWLRTGDLGFLSQGELYITGRLKDVIKINGASHYPSDIALEIEGIGKNVRPGTTVVYEHLTEAGVAVSAIVELASAKYADDVNSLVDQVCEAIWRRCGCRCARVTLVQPHTVHKTSSGKVRRQSTAQALATGALAYLFDVMISDEVAYDEH